MGDGTPEAPASATVRFSLEGFEYLFTVRGFETDGTAGLTLLGKLKAVNEKIVQMGGAPIYGRGNGGQPPAKSESSVDDEEHPETKPCPVHAGMNLYRKEKSGQIWYSHKLDSGEWCNGK